MLKWLTNRNQSRRSADRLYGAIVAQSRLPAFYVEAGVPDTVTGRFEMIVLHMFLVLERLQAETSEAANDAEHLGQVLNEAFVTDMDSAMREMGVADVRVGQRIHEAAGAYFGRLMAYRRAFAAQPSGVVDLMADAIARNVLAETAAGGADAAAGARVLAGYARAVAGQLTELSLASLAAGMIPERYDR